MNPGHGNHWECLQKPVEEAIEHFIPAVMARGIMALVVTDQAAKRKVFFSGFPFAAKGGGRRLRLTEIRGWGKEIEVVLVGETEDEIPTAFFDTRYFANRDRYLAGAEYDFRLAGLIYTARCTNDETIEITDQERIVEHHAAFGQEPGRRPDGTLEPIAIKIAGCTGYAATSEEYPEDAEFYCVIGKVTEFDFEGIRIFQITPKGGGKQVPLPGLIFGAASVFKMAMSRKPGTASVAARGRRAFSTNKNTRHSFRVAHGSSGGILRLSESR